MGMIVKLLDRIYWNNPISEWLTALGVALIVMILVRLVKWGLVRYFSKRNRPDGPDVYELAATLARRTKLPFIMILAVYAGLQVLQLPKGLLPWVHSVSLSALILQLTIWSASLVDYFLDRSRQRDVEENAARETTLRAAGVGLKLVLVIIAVLLILDNIPGVEITALVASLGIGGIAVALAVQNILSDLFASLSIVLDKPFVIGDFIIVDDYLGSVEHIGLKTTRVRSLSGEQLVFSNNDLLKSRVRNYKRMAERRVLFSIGVTYQTPAEKLERIPDIIRRIIESQQTVRFDRAHFQGYGDFALNFEVVYYVLDADYNRYMDIQQAINIEIFRSFGREDIEFAYPTRTLHIMGKSGNDANRSLALDAEQAG